MMMTYDQSTRWIMGFRLFVAIASTAFAFSFMAACSDCPTCSQCLQLGDANGDGDLGSDGAGITGQDTGDDAEDAADLAPDESVETGDMELDEDADAVEDTADLESDTAEAVCGDGEVGGDEQCDLGEENGPNSNCLINCANNPIQTIVLGGEFIGTYDDNPAVDGRTDDTTAVDGEGSWGTTPDEDTNLDGHDKFEVFLEPNIEELNFGSFTIDDIVEIFYWTLKPEESPLNFYVLIYTEPDVEDDTGWYGYRLTGEPVYARNLDAPTGEWNRWSTADGPNQLTFFDYDNLHSYGVAAGQPTLGELQDTDSFDWSTVSGTGNETTIDYGVESVLYLSIMTGSSWSAEFEGNIDRVGFTLRDGRGLIFDLEP